MIMYEIVSIFKKTGGMEVTIMCIVFHISTTVIQNLYDTSVWLRKPRLQRSLNKRGARFRLNVII